MQDRRCVCVFLPNDDTLNVIVNVSRCLIISSESKKESVADWLHCNEASLTYMSMETWNGGEQL